MIVNHLLLTAGLLLPRISASAL